MAKVTGIGGFFFRARDPEALNRWYAEHFGVTMLDSREYSGPGWFQDRGETVFSAFSHDSQELGPPEKSWKINFRVTDLDGAMASLRTAGVHVEPHDTDSERGPAVTADPRTG